MERVVTRIDISGLSLKNPIIAGCCSMTGELDRLVELEQAGVAAAVTPLIVDEEKIGPVSGLGAREKWLIYSDRRMALRDGIAFIGAARGVVTIPIIASLKPGSQEVEAWCELAARVEQAGAAAVELELFPYPRPLVEGRHEWAREVVKGVKKAVGIPVFARFATLGEEVVGLGAACKEGGADALVLEGAVPILAGVDIDSGGAPLFQGLGFQPITTGTGYWAKPIVLKYACKLSSSLQIPVITSDGISGWQDVAEHMMVGASAVHLSSLLLMKGPQSAAQCVEGLKQFLEGKGYGSAADIVGLAQKYIVPRRQMVFHPFVARVVEEKCTGCLICIKRLPDCLAFYQEGKIVKVAEEKCEACNLCFFICPEDAFVREVRA